MPSISPFELNDLEGVMAVRRGRTILVSVSSCNGATKKVGYTAKTGEDAATTLNLIAEYLGIVFRDADEKTDG